MKTEEEEFPADELPELENRFARIIEECDDIFETDDVPFYDMYYRMERERSFGRDGFYE